MSISRFDVYNHINRHIKTTATAGTDTIVHSPINEPIALLSVTDDVAERDIGGRPKGANKKNKQLVEHAILAAKANLVKDLNSSIPLSKIPHTKPYSMNGKANTVWNKTEK